MFNIKILIQTKTKILNLAIKIGFSLKYKNK